MRIVIGSDHAGFAYKLRIAEWLRARGHEVVDLGTHSADPVDYPAMVRPVAERVARGEFARGIVLGGSGNGEAIVANRLSGVRCSLCWNEESARLARAHNDANMLSLGQRLVSIDEALRILTVWMDTSFDGGRHARRIAQIDGPERTPSEGPAPLGDRVALRDDVDLVQLASEASFPASDPPPWSPLHSGAPADHPDPPRAG